MSQQMKVLSVTTVSSCLSKQEMMLKWTELSEVGRYQRSQPQVQTIHAAI